jgi:hypothetical protein
MKKLRLELEQLSVESFATAAAGIPQGTVEGYGTFRGNTCQAVNTCGPQTCGQLYCVIDTADPCGGGGTIGCPAPTATCPPPSGQMSCDGCTSYDYTNHGGDSCDYCMSFGTDSPQRCPCI